MKHCCWHCFQHNNLHIKENVRNNLVCEFSCMLTRLNSQDKLNLSVSIECGYSFILAMRLLMGRPRLGEDIGVPSAEQKHPKPCSRIKSLPANLPYKPFLGLGAKSNPNVGLTAPQTRYLGSIRSVSNYCTCSNL